MCDAFGKEGKWRNLAKVEVADIIAPAELERWITGSDNSIEAVVHLGAISSTTEADVDAILETNFRMSLRLWRWCAQQRVPFVYASSAATYGSGDHGFGDDISLEYLKSLRPLNPYGWSKHLFDKWIAREVERGDPCPPQWVGLKFFNVYGPNEYHKGDMQSVIAKAFSQISQKQTVRLFKSHDPQYADGGQLRDFVYVKDCVRVVLWLLENGHVSGMFNVGTGQPRSFLDIACALKSAMNCATTIEFIDIPKELQRRYQYRTVANVTRLRKAGYGEPFFSLEAGIQDYVNRHLANNDPYVGSDDYEGF